MEVSFIKRRKILKKTNALDLIPIQLLQHELKQDNKISLLLPRFKNPIIKTLMSPFRHRGDIHINLDQFGSATWLLIDGKKSVSEICKDLNNQFPEILQPVSETEERVSKFLSLLYQQRFISFLQIQDVQ